MGFSTLMKKPWALTQGKPKAEIVRMRNVKKEYLKHRANSQSVLRNTQRKRARRYAEKMGLVRPHDGNVVHHIDNNPDNNTKQNIAILTQKAHRKIKGFA